MDCLCVCRCDGVYAGAACDISAALQQQRDRAREAMLTSLTDVRGSYASGFLSQAAQTASRTQCVFAFDMLCDAQLSTSNQLETHQLTSIATCISAAVTPSSDTLTPMLRSAALHAATAVLQGTANVGLPVTAATSLLSALAAVSESNQKDVARGVIAASDSHADAIVAAVGQVADQLAARVEIGGDALVVSSVGVQVREMNNSATV